MKSASSAFGASDGNKGSSAIPQIGQLPGSSRTISGCIGQVHRVPGAARSPTFAALPDAKNHGSASNFVRHPSEQK